MLKKLFLALVALIVVFAIVVALQPASYRIVRSTKIAAPPGTVFPLVNDFHKWDAWSPWAKLDPAMKTTFEGPTAAPGSIYKWSGNKEVGEGQMTLLESKLNELVRIKLEFLKPFADTCATDFTFKPDGNGTDVNWSMSGNRNFVAKAICLFMNMDKLVGGDFEKGLAKMKSEAEGKK
ncbi:polyketide cyclase [Verrucomicrobia bacterium SCGC AG-212-E04]|nr:polyketide cyclase [Verrucomicrobia bacterium SCGC AG-212-E04]